MSSFRWTVKTLLAVGGVALIGFAAYNFTSVYFSKPIHLTLSGGNACPLRSEMALRISGEVHDSGLILDIVRERESDSIADDVNDGKLDVGLVLGGFQADSYPNLRQVATLGVEPLHLVVRGDLVQNAPPTLELLRGRRVLLGEQGTNAALLAEDLLRFAGFRRGDYMAVHSTEGELYKQLRILRGASPSVRLVVEASLPDAILLVDGMPSRIVDSLVNNAGYVLVPLPYATALQLDNRRSHRPMGHRLEHSRVQAVTIPAYTYGVAPAMPPEDAPTLGLRLLLVTHKDTPTTAVIRMLRLLEKGKLHRDHVDFTVSSADSEFPLHPGAMKFAAENRPISPDEVLEPLGDLLSVIGAGIAGLIALWGFLRGLRKVNPDEYLRQIDRIERLLQGTEQDETAPKLPLDFIAFLETRLAQIKQSAIEDYAHRRYQDDGALVSILTLIADTRHLLVQRRRQLEAQGSRGARMAEAA